MSDVKRTSERITVSIPKKVFWSIVFVMLTGVGGFGGFWYKSSNMVEQMRGVEGRLIRVEERLQIVSDELRELRRVLNLKPSISRSDATALSAGLEPQDGVE